MAQLRDCRSKPLPAMNKRSVDNGTMFEVVAEHLTEGKSVTVSVLGRSMRPFFSSGETITIHPIEECAMFEGSVIFARIGKRRYAVHRIMEIEGDKITMMGDGNVLGREVVHRNDIYGYVECSERHLRWAKVWRWLLPVRRYLIAIDRRVFK